MQFLYSSQILGALCIWVHCEHLKKHLLTTFTRRVLAAHPPAERVVNGICLEVRALQSTFPLALKKNQESKLLSFPALWVYLSWAHPVQAPLLQALPHTL